jgi:hypothetical protein
LRVIVMGKKRGVKRAGAGVSLNEPAVAAVASLVGTLAMNAILMPAGGWGYIVFRPGAGLNTTTYEADPYCLKCWSFVNGLPDSHSGGKEPALALAISPDGSKALSATPSNIIDLWSLPSV